MENETPDLQKDIFKPIVKRVKSNKYSLKELRRFAKNMGFEGWLKVEAIAALGKKVKKVKNKGADLVLKGGTEIELKCATNFSLSWIKNGALKYKTPCLFLGDGSDKEKFSKLKSDVDIMVIDYETFNDSINDWIIGMIRPSTIKEKKESKAKTTKRKKQIKSHRPSGKGAPQLHTVKSFNELQEVIRIRSRYYPTNYMDLLLLDNKRKRLSQLIKQFRCHIETIDNKDFQTVARLKNHIKYRENHDGWKFNISGDLKDPVVMLIGFKKNK